MPKKSNVWHYFTRLRDGHGNVIKKARCNYCTDRKEFETKDGTANLWRHFRKFHPQEAAAATEGGATAAQQRQPPRLPSAPSGSNGASTDHEPVLNEDESLQLMFQRQFKSSTEKVQDMAAAPPLQQQQTPLPPLPCSLSQEPSLEGQAHHEPEVDEKDAIRELARMIVFHGYDPSVVEDDHFRNFVRHLNPEFKLPSREKIDEMCDDVFTQSWNNRVWPQSATGRYSLAVGTTKSMETIEALYITGHFIDDEWNLHRVVDQAYVVLPPGNYNNKVNVLGMPTVSHEVSSERVASYIKRAYYFDDLVMVTREITSSIGHHELKRCIKQQCAELEVTSTAYMDHVLHSIARCLLDSDIIGDFFSNINDSEWTLQLQSRQKLLSDLDLDDPLEYNEHWYWCYCYLKILIHKLQRILSQSVILLFHLWEDIYSAIKRVSACSTPTSNLCLEELFKVRDALVLRSQQSGATIAAHGPLIRKAQETVDKAIEDSYLVWSIPLVLDPRYKLRHVEEKFKKVCDDAKAADYVSKVTRKIKELYTSYIDDDSDEKAMAVDSTSPQDQAWDEQCNSQDDNRARTKTELDHYLEDSPARTTKDVHFDILNWWKVHGSVQYPTVAEMAMDALAMPTCSKLTCDQIAEVRSFIRGYARI